MFLIIYLDFLEGCPKAQPRMRRGLDVTCRYIRNRLNLSANDANEVNQEKSTMLELIQLYPKKVIKLSNLLLMYSMVSGLSLSR